MKPRFNHSLQFARFSAIACLCVCTANAAAVTWDGGGADGNWSTAANWSTDVAPAATNDTLIFAGTTNLNAVNDLVTSINVGTSITFASGAGSFNLSGNALTLGSGGGGGITIISQQSANPQTISNNINLSGGNGDRSIVFGAGAGSLTLSGNINFSSDWLFPTTTAGTIILSGTNTGDGKATNAITAGTNIMRAMMRNNVANTVLVLGNDSALGNSGTGSASAGTASFRGVLANTNLFVRTNANRNLSGSTLAINNSWIDFNSTSNLTIGNIITVAGNRDLKVTDTGTLTVSNGIFLSQDQTARQLFCNFTGTGGMVVNGTINDTFHSGGITTRVNDVASKPTNSIFRKAGTATMTLNGDSSSTFHGDFRIETNGGKVILGHNNALGATSTTYTAATTTGDLLTDSPSIIVASTTGIAVGQTVTGPGIPTGTTVTAVDTGTSSVTMSANATADGTGVSVQFTSTMAHLVSVGAGGTLDLNGHTIEKTFNSLDGVGTDGNGALINSDAANPAALTLNVPNVGNLTVGGAGDITVPRLIGPGIRTITKKGAGKFTTNGTSHNNLCAWVISEGTVVFANTAGLASDRGTTLNGGTLRLSGLNSQLINDGQTFTINSGVFDLNGKSEAVASIDGTGGTVLNGAAATTSTLYVGGGPAGTSTASYAGTITDGTGTLKLTKEGTGTQTLTGTLSYTGNTTVNGGTLSLANASLNDASSVIIATGAFLNLTHASTDTVAALTLGGVAQPSGVYGATGSGAQFEVAEITGTGKIQVVAASGYTSWATSNAGGQTPSQDFDNDGVSNGVEYFMGATGSSFTANPGVSSGSVTWTNGGNIPSSAYGTEFVVQTSTNLVNWTPVPAGSLTTNTSGPGGSLKYTLPTGETKVFARLVVTPN